MAQRKRFNFRDILGKGNGMAPPSRVSSFRDSLSAGQDRPAFTEQGVSESLGIPMAFNGVSRNPWGRPDVIARHANTLMQGGTIGAGYSDDIAAAQKLVDDAGGPRQNAFGQLSSALMSDLENDQTLRDEQYNRVNNEIEGLRGFFGQGAEEYTQQAGQDADRLRSVAEEQRALFEQKADDVMGQYEDYTAQQLSNSTAAIERRFQSDLQMVNSGTRPDGTLMSPGEQAAMRQQLSAQIGSEVFTQMTNIQTSFNQTRAQLGLALNEQRLNSFQVQNQMEMQASAITQAAGMQALQFEAQGRMAIAELVRSNPRTSVSLFEGMSALFALATAPGAANVRGFQL